jgi:hydrogenase maturation factor
VEGAGFYFGGCKMWTCIVNDLMEVRLIDDIQIDDGAKVTVYHYEDDAIGTKRDVKIEIVYETVKDGGYVVGTYAHGHINRNAFILDTNENRSLIHIISMILNWYENYISIIREDLHAI